MVDKNPYEKDDVNVPDFTNQETNGDGPIFDMDTTSISTQTDPFDPIEEAESSSKTAIVVLIAFLILFVIGSITGWIFGITKSKEAANIKEEFDSYKITAQKQISDLETQVSTLEASIQTPTVTPESTTTTEGESSTTTTSGTLYKVVSTTGLSVRPAAGKTDAYAAYDKLKADVQKKVSNNGTSVSIANGTEIGILSTQTVGSQVWGQIDDNAWICLKDGNDELATKK